MNLIKDYSKKWPPGPEKFTTVIQSFQRNEASALLDMCQQYGDVVHYKMGATPHYLINHPDYIEHVFLRNDACLSRDTRNERIQSWGIQGDLARGDGITWEQNHSLIAPLLQEDLWGLDANFFSEKIAQHFEDVIAKKSMGSFALFPAIDNLVSSLLWQVFIGEPETSNAQKLARHLSSIEREFSRRSHLLYPLPPLRNTPRDRWFQRCTLQLREIIQESLNAQSNVQRSGFLQSLLESHDEETRAQLSEERVLDVVLGLFETAYSPLTSFLEFMLLCVATNSGQLETLRLQDFGNSPIEGESGVLAISANDSADRSPADCVMMETLRLFPPKYMVSRRVLTEISVGGYQFERGALVCVSPYALHRRPEQWDRVNEFVPDRFKRYHPAATEYLPFGLGVSRCLGETLLKRIGHDFLEQMTVHFKNLSMDRGGMDVSSGWTLQVADRESQVIAFQSSRY